MKTTAELKKEGKIAIVGAGPAGLTLARIMSRDGFDVTVYERDASSTARSQGGSLDLRPDSGQQAITAAGLMEEFTRHSRSEAKAFKLVNSQGVEQPGAGQETHEDAGPEIDRGDLRQLLIDALPKGMIAWGHTLKTLTRADGDRWILDFENQASVTANLVVGLTASARRFVSNSPRNSRGTPALLCWQATSEKTFGGARRFPKCSAKARSCSLAEKRPSSCSAAITISSCCTTR